jgi:protein gp37
MSISWTDATWNPVTGCTKVSDGCLNCYIERTPPFRMSGRAFACPRCGGTGKPLPGARCTRCWGTGRIGIGDTTGVRMHEDRLDVPLRWRKPRKVFVCSMADLFHDSVSSSFIASVFAVMALTPQHTYQVLTKRPARMRALLGGWPLPNVWLGVSVEDQGAADLRIPILLDTPAVVRWLSCEPLLGPVNLDKCGRHRSGDIGDSGYSECFDCRPLDGWKGKYTSVEWVVVGGESGPNARPMHPNWARSLRDQCALAGVPFHFKQWGEWAPAGVIHGKPDMGGPSYLLGDRETWLRNASGTYTRMRRVGKTAGRLLDGVLHDAYPGGAA